MKRILNKYKNCKKALRRLTELEKETTVKSDILRDALIQRFEFSFELVWKFLKVYLEDQGIQNINSPKSVLKAAFTEELIIEEDTWLEMLKDRNLTSHIYDEKTAIQISNRIIDKYIGTLNSLIIKMEDRVCE